jgi:hypothetical protein
MIKKDNKYTNKSNDDIIKDTKKDIIKVVLVFIVSVVLFVYYLIDKNYGLCILVIITLMMGAVIKMVIDYKIIKLLKDKNNC